MSVDALIDGYRGTTCDIYTRTKGKDAIGGRSPTDALREQNVRCFAGEAKGETRTVRGRETVVTTRIWFFKNDVTLYETDRLKKDDRYWDIEFLDNPHDMDNHQEAHSLLIA